MILSKVRRIISSLWSKKPQIDYLECHYALMDSALDIQNELELNRLITERDRLKKAKKKHSQLDRRIELLKAHSITRMMRAGK